MHQQKAAREIARGLLPHDKIACRYKVKIWINGAALSSGLIRSGNFCATNTDRIDTNFCSQYWKYNL